MNVEREVKIQFDKDLKLAREVLKGMNANSNSILLKHLSNIQSGHLNRLISHRETDLMNRSQGAVKALQEVIELFNN